MHCVASLFLDTQDRIFAASNRTFTVVKPQGKLDLNIVSISPSTLLRPHRRFYQAHIKDSKERHQDLVHLAESLPAF